MLHIIPTGRMLKMIHRLSELLTQYFMKYGQATDKAEVYIYGIECFISEFIGK